MTAFWRFKLVLSMIGLLATVGFVTPTFADEAVQPPAITAVDPLLVTANETLVKLTGRGFGVQYEAGKDKICVQDRCFLDPFISSYIQSWSDTEIQLRVPAVELSGSVQILILKWKSFQEAPDQKPVYDVLRSPAVTYSVPPDPEILSINPLMIAAYNTLIMVQGHGFGKEYVPGSTQICFSGSCVRDEDRAKLIELWSDSEIRIKAPPFVGTLQNPVLQLRVFFPKKNSYQGLVSSQPFSVQQAPIPERYFPKMITGNIYTITGKNFQEQQGKIYIGFEQLIIKSWKPDSITFQVTDNARSGDMVIETLENLRSPLLAVEIDVVKRYSDDQLSSHQSYFDNIRIPEAWKLTEGIPEVIVAVIDSGFDRGHEDLNGVLWKNPKEIENNNFDDDGDGLVDDIVGWNFVENSPDISPVNGHGTMVASIIAAQKNNRFGFSGIAPKVKIMPLVVDSRNETDKKKSIRIDSVLRAIQFAVDHGASIINLSLSGTFTKTYLPAIQYAYDNNVLVVVAAGNERQDIDEKPVSPICNDGDTNIVLGVASVTADEKLSSFSNFGKSCVDISAPGSDLVVASPMETGRELNYSVASGTSFAAPVVAGVAALLKSLHPDWNVEEIKTALISTARSLDNKNPTFGGKMGKGIIDAYAALTVQKPVVNYTLRAGRALVIPKTNEVTAVERPDTVPIKNDEPMKAPPKTLEKPASEPVMTVTPPAKVEKPALKKPAVIRKMLPKSLRARKSLRTKAKKVLMKLFP